MSMHVISPVDNLEEVEALLSAGADELYGGYVPNKWMERFGLLGSINQRTFSQAQIDSFEELQSIVACVHQAGKSFSLTLNAPFYSDRQLPLILELVDEAVAAGVDGIILADLGLLRRLRRRHERLELHASTLAHISNSGAVDFYRRQGIDRVVFPRHLTTDEMGQIAAACPDVRFDAFLLVGKCPNTEGLCTFHHSSPERIWPCEVPYAIRPLEQPAPEALQAPEVLQAAMARQGSWSHSNRRHGCGLCAIPALVQAGLYGLKLVGRGAATAQKVLNISAAREFLQLAKQEKDFTSYRRLAMAAHRRRFGAACEPNVCYYPEFYNA